MRRPDKAFVRFHERNGLHSGLRGDGLPVGGHEAREFLEPVEDDGGLRPYSTGGRILAHDHDEAPSIRRDVVVLATVVVRRLILVNANHQLARVCACIKFLHRLQGIL